MCSWGILGVDLLFNITKIIRIELSQLGGQKGSHYVKCQPPNRGFKNQKPAHKVLAFLLPETR